MDAGRIDFNRVAMFVHIAEAGGVTAAAAKLKLPKSSVSRGLTQLESELGVELVLRGTRRFQLSDAGRAFFEAAAKGIAAVEDARDEVRDDKAVPRGRVRVAAPPTFGTWLLAPVIASFVRKYPHVQVELAISGRQIDPVRDGFDLVLSVGKLADSSSRVRPLGTVDAAVYGSPTYLRERGTPQRPHDLARHECVLYQSTGKKDRWALTGPTGTTVVVVDGHVRVDDLFTATATAANHGGLAVLPVHLPASDAGTLVRVLPDYVVRGEPAQLVYPASRHVPLRVSLLCEAIVAGASATCPTADARLSAVAKQAAPKRARGGRPAARSVTLESRGA